MSQDYENMKQLFGRFSKGEINTPLSSASAGVGSAGGWTLIRKKLILKNFLKFSFYKFNSYYAALIITASGAGTVALVHNNGVLAKNSDNQDIVAVDTAVSKEDSTALVSDITIEDIQPDCKEEDNAMQTQKKDEVTEQLIRELLNDTAKLNQVHAAADQYKTIKKEVVYVKKRDTIIQYDTIRIKK
jgi:hypothetical protein